MRKLRKPASSSLVGTWVQRRQLPIRPEASRPEYLIGLVTEDNAVESRAANELHFGDADTMAAANECDYYVEWEHDNGGSGSASLTSSACSCRYHRAQGDQ